MPDSEKCLHGFGHDRHQQGQRGKVGDEIHLMGGGAKKEPNAWDYAKVDRTIPYEVLTRISPRVLRTKHA
ncbi:MAG: alanine racemase C-terminal domain-containing protein [Bdellovibrionota bacterium]